MTFFTIVSFSSVARGLLRKSRFIRHAGLRRDDDETIDRFYLPVILPGVVAYRFQHL